MKQLLMAVAVCLVMTACEKAIDVNEQGQQTEVGMPDGTVAKAKKFTFTMKGDFSDDWKTTRGYLAADGRDMTDVWVLDYMNGQLAQQLHQGDNTADDFGKPQMSLAYGSHHVYFVASRGTTPTLNVGAHSIVWERPSDTFWKDYEVNVVSTSNGNRVVTLDRVATKLRLTFTDFLPADAAVVKVSPHTWYYGLNYQSGEGVADSPTPLSVNIPSNYIGTTNLVASFYTISSASPWQTDVTVALMASDESTIGSITISDVPLQRNHVTSYAGGIVGAGRTLNLGSNDEWVEDDTVNW